MFKKEKILISVCIPVFNTQNSLLACLESVAAQDFSGTEIVITEDGDKKEKETLKIIKDFKKSHKNLKITFLKNEKNKGLVETRRTSLYESTGDYITFLDSDDTLPQNALNTLYETAQKSDADIVHGKANVCIKEGLTVSKERIESTNKKCSSVFLGNLNGSDILDGFLSKRNHNGFLWGKLFKKELCLEAFAKIPPVYCIFCEDFLTYFYLALCAQKYSGIEEKVYNYFINTGISSEKKITTMEEWQKVCSTASVFTILLSDIQENLDLQSKLTETEIEVIKFSARYYAKSNLKQMLDNVIPELKDATRAELCEWWGQGMIDMAEKELQEKK